MSETPRVSHVEKVDKSVRFQFEPILPELWVMPEHVNALREYFTRPKELTPRERADNTVRQFVRSYKGFDEVPSQVWNALINIVTSSIEDAARRGVDWVDE